MAKVSAVAKLTVNADKIDDFMAAMTAMCEYVAANEPGTEQYVAHQSQTEPNVFFITEVYTDQAAVDAHSTSPGMVAFGEALGGVVEGAELTFANPGEYSCTNAPR